MKRFKKIMTLGAVTGVICLMATGCGEMTAEKLTEKVNEATAGKEMTSAELLMDLDASYAMDVMGVEMSMDFDMDLDLNQLINVSPFAGYSDGSIKMNVMDQEIDTEIQGHTVIEDDKIVTYSYTGMTNSWTREETGMSASEYEEFLLTAPTFGDEAGEAVLEEETTQLDGTEVYVLQANYSGEDVEEVLSDAGPMGGLMDVGEGSMADMSIPVTIYVDAKTFLPVQMDMEIKGMDDFVNQMLMGELESLGELTADSEITVEVEKCHVILKNFSYEAQEIPEVPQEALDSIALAEALESADAILADGRYLLKYESNALAVSEVDGYTGNITDGMLELYSEDGMKIVVVAAMPAGMTGAIADEAIGSYEQMFTALGVTLEMSEAPEAVETQFGQIDVTWMGADGLNIYYSTVPAKGLDLFVMAVDMAGEWQSAADILVPVTDAVSEVTLADLQ